jgi:type VI secretion system protein ImpK
MNKAFGRIVYRVLGESLAVRDRLERGEALEIEPVRQEILALVRSESEGRRLPDYVGDGTFLGARYALACWVDELFIIHCQPPWADDWKERTLEYELFGTNVAANRFWEQADIVLRRPGAPRTATQPGPDAIETFFLCIVLGFRGTYFDGPARVREYVEEMRPMLARPAAWQPPRDLGVRTNAAPLVGRESLRRVVGIYGGATLVLALVLLALSRF